MRQIIIRRITCVFRFGMAQNINPFYSSQNAPSKAAEEKQNISKDKHAVSKRYANFFEYLKNTTDLAPVYYLFITILLSIAIPDSFHFMLKVSYSKYVSYCNSNTRIHNLFTMFQRII